MNPHTLRQVLPAIAKLRRSRAASRNMKRKLLAVIGRKRIHELREIAAGTAEALLREIAEKDGAAIRELLDAGIEVPAETLEFCNRSRLFLGMPLLSSTC